jgi:outer membrane protein assembly factor BamB
LAVLVVASIAARAADWPQFRGPNRDAVCKETGLLKEWPEAGPKLLWKMQGLGRGYASIAIVGDKFYTMGDRKSEGEEKQCVVAFDLGSRKGLWSTPIGPPHGDGGPRCTPTVDGESLYAIGTDGNLVCLETATGKVRWQKNFGKDFGGKMMSGWRYSESPLVDGEQLVCTPGGREALLVALNKQSGEVIWKCAAPGLDAPEWISTGSKSNRGQDGAGYSSIVPMDVDGARVYVQIVGRGAVGVDAKTGKFLFGYNKVANGVANIPTPVVKGNHVFVTTSYETGSALLKVVRDGDTIKAEEVYFLPFRQFENHHGGVILVGDHLYGGSLRNNGVPTCLDFLTGKIAWKGKSPGSGSAAILYADGKLIFRYDNGTVALIEADPSGFKLQGKFKAEVVDGPAWQYPVIVDGKLYLRAHDTLMCYDLKGSEETAQR